MHKCNFQSAVSKHVGLCSTPSNGQCCLPREQLSNLMSVFVFSPFLCVFLTGTEVIVGVNKYRLEKEETVEVLVPFTQYSCGIRGGIAFGL